MTLIEGFTDYKLTTEAGNDDGHEHLEDFLVVTQTAMSACDEDIRSHFVAIEY